MTDLVLVRHGETVWHAENRYAGSSDVALTPRGPRAGRAARRVGADRPPRRGLVVAAAAARGAPRRPAPSRGLPLEVDARLRELDFGDGEGLTSAEMTERFPDARAAFLADPVAHHLPGGEDPVEAADRFTECLHEIAEQASRRPRARRRPLQRDPARALPPHRRAAGGVPAAVPALRNCALTELRLRARAGRAVLQFNTPPGSEASSRHDPCARRRRPLRPQLDLFADALRPRDRRATRGPRRAWRSAS